MRKSGLTGDEAYALSKRRGTSGDLDPLKKELSLLKEDISQLGEYEESRNLIEITKITSYPSDFIDEFNECKVVDDFVTIKGKPTYKATLYLKFTSNIFDAGTYYVHFDGNFPSQYFLTFGDNQFELKGDNNPYKVILNEQITRKYVELYINNVSDNIDFSGHIWITKDEPQEYIKRGAIVFKPDVYTKSESDNLYERKRSAILLKPTILLIFDNGGYDNRATLLKQYGMKATFAINNISGNYFKNENLLNGIKELVYDGHDIAVYSGTGTMPSTYTSESDKDNWYNYIKNAIDELRKIGIFYPTQYGCRMHVGSKLIYDACEKLGFKYVSCGYELVNGESWEDPSTVFNSTQSNGIDKLGMAPYNLNNKTIEQIKSEIDSIISNNLIVPLFTHNVVENGDSTNCSISIYTQMLEYLKPLKESGSVDVLTMREFYNKYHPDDGKELDYKRVTSGILSMVKVTSE